MPSYRTPLPSSHLPMDSPPCSPSILSLKTLKSDGDRPRSRLVDIKRPASLFSRSHSASDRSSADRAPDKGSPGFSPRHSFGFFHGSSRERGDGVRESWRKGFGGSAAPERESVDGFDEGGERVERIRYSPRNSQGYERPDRHHGLKSFSCDRDRSERSDCPRMPLRRILEHDRESSEKPDSTRATARRFYSGDCRQETVEGSTNHSSQEEKAARKGSGFDKDTPARGNAARDAGGKGSSGPERNGQEGLDPRKSPSWQGAGAGRDGKEVPKISPRRVHAQDRDRGAWEPGGKGYSSKDCGPEKDVTKTPKTSPRKFSDVEKDGKEMHKNSPGRASGTDREPMEGEEMCKRASPRSKSFHNTDEEKSFAKANGSISSEVYTRVWNRSNSSSKSYAWKQDALEERKAPAIEGHDEGSRKTSPDSPHSPPHIGKRSRSERERWRREEPARSQASKDVRPKDGREDEPEEAGGQKTCSMETLGTDMVGREEESVNANNLNSKGADETDEVTQVSSASPHVAVAEPQDRKLDTTEEVKMRDSSSQGLRNEIEEGELEPEGGLAEEERKELETLREKPGTDTEMEEQGKGETSEDHRLVSEGNQACERMLVDGAEEEESSPNRSEDGSREGHQTLNKICNHIDSKEMIDMNKEQGVGIGIEDKDDELPSMTTKACSARDLEVGQSSKADVALDFLLDVTAEQELHTKQGNLETNKKDHDLSGELMLSLLMIPSRAEAGSFKQKECMTGSQNTSIEVSESPEKLQRNGKEVKAGKKSLADCMDELGELPVYGHNQKRLKMESLQLSLAPPGTSAELSNSTLPRPAGFVEPEKSIQSLTRSQTHSQNQTQTRTNSDGFTTSLSFSQSHSFVHNPSCSLNCMSVENQELSCGGSRQISQGTEWMSHRSWQTPSGNEQLSNGAHSIMSLPQDRLKHRREVPLYVRIVQNSNMQGCQGFPSVTGSNRISGTNQISQRSYPIGQRFHGASKMPDVSSQDLKASERQDSVQKDFQDGLCQQETWFASNCNGGSQETQSEPHVQPENKQLGDHLASSVKGFRSGDSVGGRNLVSEKIGLLEIATEPVAVMAQKLQELPDSFLESLKDLAKDMLGSFEKREEFMVLQDTIERRMDLTEETLLRAHLTQLEILVTLKTGMQAFVQGDAKRLTYKALIEIFLRTRCQNINCQQSLPVDGCECRICSQKLGFCQECMCVVCCKFDSDNHTARWVGCDHCMHWCHTDCGLRMSYIMPAPTILGGAGSSEMQYECVACDHRSELFGFVKEVFKNCAEGWGAETLAKELDCVRRIFHGSGDMRGKQLCWKAEQMLQKLENKVDAAEVRRSMLRFFSDGNAELDGARIGASKHSKAKEVSCHLADAGNKVVDIDEVKAALHIYSKQREEKRADSADQQYDKAHTNASITGLENAARVKQTEAKIFQSRADEAHQDSSGRQNCVAVKHEKSSMTEQQYDRACKKVNIEGLESIVWMKQAEAKMFQMCADEARQYANGLQQVVAVKREKIEDDYACKYTSLRLHEAEEKRRKQFEELQALEMAQHDYQNMKIRMTADIKDLLKKMEMTKRQFA